MELGNSISNTIMDSKEKFNSVYDSIWDSVNKSIYIYINIEFGKNSSE